LGISKQITQNKQIIPKIFEQTPTCSICFERVKA
jgi:hypothetical protein